MKKHLVTGGSGFIGAGLVQRLVADGHDVRVLDNGSRGALRRLASIDGQYDYHEGDIRDPETVGRAVAGMDVVWHLAYVNGTEFFYSKPDLVLEVGVKGMINVIDACRAENVGELILASSSEVYQTPPETPTSEDVPLIVPDPQNPRYSYGGGKIISELLTLNNAQYFDRVQVFRPHNVYGPDMGWEHVLPQFALRVRTLAAEHPDGPLPFPIQGDGSETRAFCYIDDLVNGLMHMASSGEHRGIYHIGTQEEVAIRDIAVHVGACFDCELSIEPGPLLKGSTLRRCPDISKLASLGYQPKISLRDGIARLCAWYDQNAEMAPKSKDAK